MILERLEATDFRNYGRLELDLAAPLSIFVGRNAQGKTNILEAVHLLAMARSPRTGRDSEMVRHGAREAVLRGEARRAEGDVSVAVTLRADGAKAFRVNGQPKRAIEAVGTLTAVLFAPGDLELVSGAPQGRREFINACLGQSSPAYLAALGAYRRLLRQRNALLHQGRERRIDPDLLLSFDDQLAGPAAVLMTMRRDRLALLAAEAAAVHHRLSGGAEELGVHYEPHIPLPPDESLTAATQAVTEHLIARRDAELRRGLTLVGPHRDDLRLTINELDARSYASQGQQRTAALALKIAELRVLTQWTGEPPLLLLDDVMSELDAGRRSEVLGLGAEAEQVLITCSDERTFEAGVLRQAGVYRVAQGTVTRGGEPA